MATLAKHPLLALRLFLAFKFDSQSCEEHLSSYMFYICHYYLQGQISRNEAEWSKQIHIFLELEHLLGAEADSTRMGPILALQLGPPPTPFPNRWEAYFMLDSRHHS